jgi:predicted helicase
LKRKIKFLLEIYNKDLNLHKGKEKDEIRNVVDYSIKWTRAVKNDLQKGKHYQFNQKSIIDSLYRPFVRMKLYFNKELNEMQYQQDKIFPISNVDNNAICVNHTSAKDFNVIATNLLPDYHVNGDANCIPFYRYDINGNKIENITDWGLTQFTKQYGKKGITKEAIFHYVYAVLHNPVYRTKHELNLKREFPRVPFYTDFQKWSNWGKQLMDLHIKYEQAEPYNLMRLENTYEAVSMEAYQGFAKAKLKADKTNGTIILDGFTTLEGIPAIAWRYKLGNRSALEWILDQYKESKPKDPTIAEKFNTYKFADYKEQVIDLLCRVCTVSVETMLIVDEMEKA